MYSTARGKVPTIFANVRFGKIGNSRKSTVTFMTYYVKKRQIAETCGNSRKIVCNIYFVNNRGNLLINTLNHREKTFDFILILFLIAVVEILCSRSNSNITNRNGSSIDNLSSFKTALKLIYI